MAPVRNGSLMQFKASGNSDHLMIAFSVQKRVDLIDLLRFQFPGAGKNQLCCFRLPLLTCFLEVESRLSAVLLDAGQDNPFLSIFLPAARFCAEGDLITLRNL